MGALVEAVKFQYPSNSYKMQVDFTIEDKWLNVNTTIPFLIDSGAESVLLPANDLFISEKQQEVIMQQCKEQKCSGIVPGKYLCYYKYAVTSFKLQNNIILHDFPIYITFDKQSTIKLVGMSFLKLFSVFIQPQCRSILFSALPFTQKIVSGQSSARNIEQVFIPEVGVEETLGLDDQAAEAHRIHKTILDNEQ